MTGAARSYDGEGDNFAQEHYAAADFGAFAAVDVDAEIHLVEIGVEGNRNGAEEFCASEAKADEADVVRAFEGIEFRAARDEWLKQSRIDLIIEHHEIAPLGGQEDACPRVARSGCGMLQIRNWQDH